jgi:hypothetical protein
MAAPESAPPSLEIRQGDFFGVNGEGLLPSNKSRRATKFPDTEGCIHVCEKLTHDGVENDSAQWWMETLSKGERIP